MMHRHPSGLRTVLLACLLSGACGGAASDESTLPTTHPEKNVMESKAKQNEELVRKFVAVAKNERKLERIGDYFAADYTEHNQTVASFGKGVAGYQAFLGHLFAAFPDDTVTIDQLVANDTWVSYRATETGTHKGTFLGIPATGKQATWTEIQFFRIENGKVVEHWVDVDLFSWFTQLGIIPAMGK